MSDVCIKCAGKHKDFRSEYGHLTYDPQHGTVLEPHYVEPEADKDLAVLYRKAANVARQLSALTARERAVLTPSDPRNAVYNRAAHVFAPRHKYFTPSWTDEARKAFYRAAA